MLLTLLGSIPDARYTIKRRRYTNLTTTRWQAQSAYYYVRPVRKSVILHSTVEFHKILRQIVESRCHDARDADLSERCVYRFPNWANYYGLSSSLELHLPTSTPARVCAWSFWDLCTDFCFFSALHSGMIHPSRSSCPLTPDSLRRLVELSCASSANRPIVQGFQYCNTLIPLRLYRSLFNFLMISTLNIH